MSAEANTDKDYFWLYTGLATITLIAIVAMVKLSENDKFDPIRQQQAEETAMMKIKVIKDY